MKSLAPIVLALVGCGDAAPPEGASRPTLALEAPFHPQAAQTVLDGVARDVAWTVAKDVVVPMTGPGPSEVRIRAVHDGSRVYLLVRWKDSEETMTRYWEFRADGSWERHRGEDGLAVAWSPGGHRDLFREQGCALYCHDGKHRRAGESGLADFWYWGAQRTNALKQATDMALRFGEGDRLRGDTQPADSGSGVNRSDRMEGPARVPIRVHPSTRRILLLENSQPLPPDRAHALSGESVGWEVPYDLLKAARGSRGDVAALALHLDGEWTLELSRAFTTGNADDQPFGDPQVPSWFAVAAYDGTEESDHAVSPPIELRFLSAR